MLHWGYACLVSPTHRTTIFSHTSQHAEQPPTTMLPCAVGATTLMAAWRGCSGAADTEGEAHSRADALVQAGVVLRFNGIVYLKPQEVSELVYRVSSSSSSSSVAAAAGSSR
eukprot:GHRQ01024316.1.p4 GENE.GHRQ01024316.1~~GHRQ01024316.1.p4  ORF type:complete len:112 (+),score=40.42 GHRQ01024316.1:246-581(+)